MVCEFLTLNVRFFPFREFIVNHWIPYTTKLSDICIILSMRFFPFYGVTPLWLEQTQRPSKVQSNQGQESRFDNAGDHGLIVDNLPSVRAPQCKNPAREIA